MKKHLLLIATFFTFTIHSAAPEVASTSSNADYFLIYISIALSTIQDAQKKAQPDDTLFFDKAPKNIQTLDDMLNHPKLKERCTTPQQQETRNNLLAQLKDIQDKQDDLDDLKRARNIQTLRRAQTAIQLPTTPEQQKLPLQRASTAKGLLKPSSTERYPFTSKLRPASTRSSSASST